MKTSSTDCCQFYMRAVLTFPSNSPKINTLSLPLNKNLQKKYFLNASCWRLENVSLILGNGLIFHLPLHFILTKCLLHVRLRLLICSTNITAGLHMTRFPIERKTVSMKPLHNTVDIMVWMPIRHRGDVTIIVFLILWFCQLLFFSSFF